MLARALAPALLLICGAAHASPSVKMSGEQVDVRWSDGDSFKFKTGRHKGTKTRLMGYNTLESYGPVHSWGGWTGDELYQLQRESTKFAKSKVWTCDTKGEKDHYGRLLVRCDDLITAMVGEGWAHLFKMEGSKPNPAHLEAQLKAQKEKKGIWAKGVPKVIMTSTHSNDEERDGPAYNRVADTQTGVARKIEHNKRYRECEKVCMEGSCMVYAPFKRRYGRDKAKCLWPKRKKGFKKFKKKAPGPKKGG